MHRTFRGVCLARTDSEVFVTSSEGAGFSAEPDQLVVGRKGARGREPRGFLKRPSEKAGLRSSSVAALELD